MSDPQGVLTALESTPALLISLVREIPEILRRRRPQPGKWSAHEHFCHLVVQQPPMLERLERMLTEENPLIAPLNPSPEEEAGALLELDLDEAAQRFTVDRAELLARLRALSHEAWERRAEHPEIAGYTIFRLARQILLHDMLHGFRIEELLFRKEWPEAAGTGPQAVPVEKGIPGARAAMRPGEINLLGPFEVPGLAPRLVRVYLPLGYEPSGPRFGLYLFDGQNVFDDASSFSVGWHVHQIVEGLAKSRRPVPVVIGIDHAGPGRIRELSPFTIEEDPGQAEVFLEWITAHLIPALTAELNLVPGPLGAVIGGSSMGGLAAFWSHFHYPQAFGGALAMSPAFWIADQAIFADIAAQPTPVVSRIYLDGGAKEAKGQVVEAVKEMAEHLTDRGYDSDRLMWRADARGTHSEASWRRRLPKALRFMYR